MKIQHDFEFAGRTLSSFGMVLCRFGGSKGVETITDGAPINFTTIPVAGGSKHNLASSNYEECLESTVQICKHFCNGDIQEITSVEHRNLTAWLCRKKFLKLKFLDESNIDLYHEAIINVSRIELDGKLVGLELNIQTNRPFALKEPRTIIVQAKYLYTWERFYATEENTKGETTGKYVTSYNKDAYPKDGILNNENLGISHYYVCVKKELDNEHSIQDTSYEEGYIYPYTEIIIDEDGDLDIYNDLEDRHTIVKRCKSGEIITMDYPVIQSSDSSHIIQNDFNWKFFRIANTYDNSRNDLTISLPCSIKIKYSPIVKVGL